MNVGLLVYREMDEGERSVFQINAVKSALGEKLNFKEVKIMITNVKESKLFLSWIVIRYTFVFDPGKYVILSWTMSWKSHGGKTQFKRGLIMVINAMQSKMFLSWNKLVYTLQFDSGQIWHFVKFVAFCCTEKKHAHIMNNNGKYHIESWH